MSIPTPKPRAPLYLTLIAIGVFLLGGVTIPLLAQSQTKALDSVGLILSPVMLNQAAPELPVTDLQGKPVSLAFFPGKVILVNNWATWCPPCQAEMPELQAYYLAHARQGLTMVAIESGEPANIVEKFVSQNKITFPVWLDPHGSALDSFKNWDLPSSFVVDRQGTLRMSWTGPVDRATLEKYVTPPLEK
jgi:cytochrome c biogenesis protein CcmG, thiol:disulfide interchange protein DsbE